MPRAPKPPANEVIVYKDDGVWWAEVYDPDYSVRATYSSNAADFMSRVESMLWYVDLELEDVQWAPQDESAKKFLNRARKQYENGAESDADATSEEDNIDDSSAD